MSGQFQLDTLCQRLSRRRWIAGALLPLAVSALAREGGRQSPSFEAIRKCVDDYFAKSRDRRDFEIVTRSQVAEILVELRRLGWQPADEKELRECALDDQHVLVRTMKSPAGKKFLAKVAGRELIYDRLDRIAGVSGGPELIQDLVKLPDGEKYAKPRSGGGVPDLVDLLPKNASGKTRHVAHYDKPTGHVYTVDDLVARLRESYEKSKQPSSKPATEDSRRSGTGQRADKGSRG